MTTYSCYILLHMRITIDNFTFSDQLYQVSTLPHNKLLLIIFLTRILARILAQNVIMYNQTLVFTRSMYEGWNFNFGNAAVTFDTAPLQSSYFHRPSMYSPKLCRIRSQRWGSRMMRLAAPVLLMVRTERSTAEGLNPTCNCPIR